MSSDVQEDWFQPESDDPAVAIGHAPWKILIADDEPDVHVITRMALRQLQFKGRPLALLSAYSAIGAYDILARESDIALIFLDVVMETEDAGLKLAAQIRTELNNPFVRIVLRTGQPGVAKEQRVIVEYDINDYKEKTELTKQKLVTSTIASLRAYEAIQQVERGRQGLASILREAVTLHRFRSRHELAIGVLAQIGRMLGTQIDGFWCSRAIAAADVLPLPVDAATPLYADFVQTGVPIASVAHVLLDEAFTTHGHRFVGPDHVLYVCANSQQECGIYFTLSRPLLGIEIELLSVLATQVAAALDNAWLYASLMRENAERKQAEAAVRKHADEVHDLYNNAPCGYHSLDHSGRFIEINQTELDWLGYTREEVVGKLSFTDLLEGDDLLHFQDNLRRFVEHGGLYDLAYTLRRKNGSMLPVQVSATAVRDTAGKYLKSRATVYDITERKRIEAELDRYRNHLEILVEQRTAELLQSNQQLEEAHNQLLQAEKMASIGQLAAGVAHEINNPISYVISNMGTLADYFSDVLQLLAEYQHCEPELPASKQLVLQKIRTEIELDYVREDASNLMAESNEGLRRVKKIVQDLKEFSHIDDAAWQLADLHRCLDSTLNIASHELKYKATVVREYGDLPDVECLPLELNQVFMNILVNASQAITEHGRIVIRSGRTGSDAVWIEIADNGSGMPPEVIKRIFDPFFTTKPVGVGTGLGLSLSYGIVQKHHGRIEVESNPGQGTTFRICLPLRQSNIVRE